MVYSPNHPRANIEGQIFRSIVAYELYHNIQVPITMVIHHIDKNRLNDSKENLQILPFGQHSSLHNKSLREKSLTLRWCKQCGKMFMINRWRLKEESRGTFCSLECYHKYPRSKTYRQVISQYTIQSWLNPEVREKRIKGMNDSWERRRR